ncbi:MAG: tetratricopeptide repeat protein [Planctomycetota bacterium]
MLTRTVILVWAVTILAAQIHTQEIPAPVAKDVSEQSAPATYFAELADVKQRFTMYSGAAELYQTAILRAQDPAQRLHYQLSLADVLVSKGDANSAMQVWDTISKSSYPMAASKANFRLAQRLVEAGKADEAAQRLEAVALNPLSGNFRDAAIKILVPLLKSSGKAEAKLAEFLPRLKQNSQDRSLRELVLALQSDDLEGRVRTLAELIKESPRDIELQRDYGSALIAANKLDDAVHVYDAMRHNYPSEQQYALQNLAVIYIRKGTPEAAEQAVVESGAQIQDSVMRKLYFARQALQLKLFALAEKYARESFSETTSDGFKISAEMELGDALFNLGKMEEARKVLNPIAEQDVYSGLKIRAKKILSQI